MNPWMKPPVQLVGRCLMALIFIQGGWGKLTIMAAFVANLTKLGVPMPGLAYYGVVALELGGGLAILLGWQTTKIALLFAAYCVATACLVHYIPADRGQMINFYKNIAMCGGFLHLAVLGAGDWSLDYLLRRRR
jgi:putative oxidoreductase